MKLYHIDREGTLSAGQVLELNNNVHFDNEIKNQCLNLVLPYYEDGLSHHGIHYLLNPITDLSSVMDIIFEYERLLNFNDKLSRYQAFYVIDSVGVRQFIEQQNLDQSFFKIYEVESDYSEKHNMTLVSGMTLYDIAAMAKCYWKDEPDPYNRPVLYEYLLKYPVRVIKEVELNELE